jgi:hypothetical protein
MKSRKRVRQAGEDLAGFAFGNFFGERVFHLLGDQSLALSRILYARLLAHDSLILGNFALTHGEIIDKNAQRPWQIFFRSQNRFSNARLPTRGKTETQQCAE